MHQRAKSILRKGGGDGPILTICFGIGSRRSALIPVGIWLRERRGGSLGWTVIRRRRERHGYLV